MLNKSFKLLTIAALTTAVSGCITEDKKLEGVSLSGGNAIAHNTALQLVDPWPQGVHKTDLIVPSSRGGNTATAAALGNSPATPVVTPSTNTAD